MGTEFFDHPIPKPKKRKKSKNQKEKAATMEVYWVPAVNNSGKYGRWQFVEFCDVYQIEADFKERVEGEFNKMMESVVNR